MATGDRVYRSQEKFTSARNTTIYMLGPMWGTRGINKPCVFECSPAIQVWALSKIPSNPAIFPTSSLFANMDHLFWRVIPQMDDHQIAWILWYIWKGMNNNVFSNLDTDPGNEQRATQTAVDVTLLTIPGRWCLQMIPGRIRILSRAKVGIIFWRVLRGSWE